MFVKHNVVYLVIYKQISIVPQVLTNKHLLNIYIYP